MPTDNEVGSTSVHDFIVRLESSAKRVLKDANKKHREALVKEQALAIVQGRKAQKAKHDETHGGKTLSKTGSVLMKALTMSSSMLDLLDDPAATLGKMPPGTETLEMRYSVPRMFVSMATDATLNLNDGGGSGDEAGTRSHRATGGLEKLPAVVVPPRRNLVLEKLGTSPFLSASMGSLDEILMDRKLQAQRLKEERAADAANLVQKETTWALKSQVTEVMSGKHSGANSLHKNLIKKQTVKHQTHGRKTEAQGPVDWSCNGLKIKYRGENEREAAWTAWQSANAFASEAIDSKSIIMPMIKMDRHPLFVQFFRHIRAENSQSVSRTRSRLLMKRFVFDVHEVWLTNLQHLREHQPARLLTQDPATAETSDDNGNGLRNRRDAKAIEAMDAQIQSVSQKRVLERAFYTTRMPEPKVVLNYEPNSTPSIATPRPLPPTMESLVVSMRVQIGDSPNNAIYIFVDRLLPAPDRKEPKEHEIHGNVLWRISTYRHENCQVSAYLMLEAAVVAHCDAAAQSRCAASAPEQQNVVFESGKDQLLPWSVMDISAHMSVSVEHLGDIPGQPSVIRIHVHAALKADFLGDVLQLTSSPIELRYLLDKQGLPIDDAEWWRSPARAEDVWPVLFALLYIVDGAANEFGDPVPAAMAFTTEKTSADRIELALPTARAYTYAQEIMAAIRIDNNLCMTLDGAADDIFLTKTSALVEPEMETPIEAEVRAFDDNLRVGEWELAIDLRAPSLSMFASGALAYVAQVPGACEHGRMGLWFPHKMPREYTQASAMFFRDARLSTTDTVLVNMTLALDTSILFPTVLAWEDFSTGPPKCPAEEVEGYIPAIVSPPVMLLTELLISPLDGRISETASLFSTTPEEGIDHIPLDAANKPRGMMRHWPFRNEHGFRRKGISTLLGVDPVLPTIVFGITKTGAQPNVPGVNTRNIWHSTLSITEHINRPRAPKDYHYIISNSKTRGANDPAAFACRMKSGECVGLSSSAFNSFEKEYAEIKMRREIFARQLALDAKIENSQMVMKTREKALKAEMQRELQRAIEKKLRKATKSEKGWVRRFNMSTLLEVQGNWERRRDERAGTIFFRKITAFSGAESRKQQPNEKFMQTCQWEVPPTWDGDPLAVPDDEYGPEESLDPGDSLSLKSGSASLMAASSLTGPFDQPPESWHPGLDTTTTQKDGRTPGIAPQFARRAPSKDNDSVQAERSWQDPDAADEARREAERMERMAEQLLSSDDLMRIIARRLGLPEDQVVPSDELTADLPPLGGLAKRKVALGAGAGAGSDVEQEVPGAPRDAWVHSSHEPEFDSDDDLWSDDEQEAGDYDEENLGDLPQNHQDANALRRKRHKDLKGEEVSVPSQVPFLNLKGAGVVKEDDLADVGAGWRRLPRPEVPTKFFHKCTQTKTIGPDKLSCNTSNVPIFLTPISPVDACQYVPQNFTTEIESIFVPDCKRDMERAIATMERNIRREEELSKNVPTDDLLLFGAAAETTANDNYIAKQYKEDQQAFVDPKEKGMRKAILAAKSNNIAQMEDALEEEVPINTADQFGNTLLILAAQQGSKRMAKFLLRRGANINMQSLKGNTALHFCYAYSFPELGEYLKKKGADDSILNGDEMTCYEGLSAEYLGDGGGDDEEEEDLY